MSPNISVVIPAYNRRDHISRAIDSALNQTLPPSEVIVVDDCSSDDTACLVRDRYHGNPKVKVVTLRLRIGACGARNMGLATSSSEWLAFLDSDDAWEPTKLERQWAALERHPEALAAVASVRGIKDDKLIYEHRPPTPLWQGSLFFDNKIGTTSTLMVNRQALLEIGGFDRSLPSCQDWDLYLRLFDIGQVVAAPEAWVLFNEGDHPRISNGYARVVNGHRTVFSHIRNRIADPSLLREVEARQAFWHAEAAFHRGGSVLKAAVLVTAALVRHPTPRSYQRFRTLGRAMARDVVLRRLGVDLRRFASPGKPVPSGALASK